MPETPKAFICHASADKERFVLGFAERLRKGGVDAWLDEWEVLLGDSLVDRIFEEGLKGADVVIIVLSPTSVASRWVREELNAAFVRRVEGRCRLLPVVLDDCEIPECLRSTRYRSIGDTSSYDEEFKHILANIFGAHTAPPIGQAPAYARDPLPPLPGLAPLDSLILTLCCERAIETDREDVSGDWLQSELAAKDVPLADAQDSLRVLEEEGMVEIHCRVGDHDRLRSSTVLWEGFHRYIESTMPDYRAFLMEVAARAANGDIAALRAMEAKAFLVRHALEDLRRQGLVEVNWRQDGFLWGVSASPRLRRMLET